MRLRSLPLLVTASVPPVASLPVIAPTVQPCCLSTSAPSRLPHRLGHSVRRSPQPQLFMSSPFPPRSFLRCGDPECQLCPPSSDSISPIPPSWDRIDYAPT